MSLVTHADHRTQFCRRTPGSISYSVKLVILDALLPVSKLAFRLSQASEHSSVPKLTNLLITTGFAKRVLKNWLDRFTLTVDISLY